MQMKRRAINETRSEARRSYRTIEIECLAPDDVVETVSVGPRGGVRVLRKRDATDDEMRGALEDEFSRSRTA